MVYVKVKVRISSTFFSEKIKTVYIKRQFANESTTKKQNRALDIGLWISLKK